MSADAKLAAYVDRVLRMKEEADGIAEDIKAIYGEAKAEGYDKTQLGNLVTYLRKRAKDKDGEAEKEAVFDLYLSAYLRAKGEVGTERATRTHAPDEITEPQSAPRAAQGSNVAAEPVASQPHPEAKASDDGGTTAQAIEGPADSVTGDASRASVGAGSDAPIHAGSSNGRTAAFDAVNAGSTPAPASKPMYAAPGLVTEEHTPPEPVRRHPISAAFAELGQNRQELRDAIYRRAGGVAKPIVKIGAEILDGWARYDIARSLFIDYPVQQYVGTDILADAINWNLESRKLTQGQISMVISRLVKLYPDREQEILGMFDAEYAEAAE